MYKNDMITAKDGKFTFPDLGDACKEAILLTFIAIETVSIDYARKKMYSDGKENKYSLNNLSKEMIDIQKKLLAKSTDFFYFIDSTFQFEFFSGKVKKIESNFFKTELEKYAYVMNKMYEYIFSLQRKYNVSDEEVKKLGECAKNVNKKMHSDSLENQIIDLIFKKEVKINIKSDVKNGNGVIEGQPYILIITLYALKELIENIDLDKSKPTVLKFNTENNKLFIDASGDKKILNTIINNSIIRVQSELDENINNESYNKELGHILYHLIKKELRGEGEKDG